MARTPIKNIIFAERVVQAAISQGQPIIVKNTQGATATVYSDTTGTGTLTNSFSLATNPALLTSGLPGYLEPGEYTFTCGGAIGQDFDTGEGDLAAMAGGASPQRDGSLSATVFVNGWYGINSVAATTTSQTIKFIRIIPTQRIVAAKVVIVSGSTAVA